MGSEMCIRDSSEPGGGEFHPGFKAQGEAVDRVQVEVRPHPPTPRKTGSKIKTVRCLFARCQVSKGRRQRGVFAFVTFLCFVPEARRVERQFQRTFFFVEQSTVKFKTQECFCATPSLPRQKTAGRTCSKTFMSCRTIFHSVIYFFSFRSPPPRDVEILVGRGSPGHTCKEKKRIISSDKSDVMICKRIART